MGQTPAQAGGVGVMKYQYEQIIKHLLLLQDHAAARTCPYTPGGEMCIRKHLLTIEAYARETLAMESDPALQAKLAALESEAQHYRYNEEQLLCGEQVEAMEGLEHWARKQRKEFELHPLPCRLREAYQAEPEPVREAVGAPC